MSEKVPSNYEIARRMAREVAEEAEQLSGRASDLGMNIGPGSVRHLIVDLADTIEKLARAVATLADRAEQAEQEHGR